MVSMVRAVGIPAGIDPPEPPGVTSGVEVLRGVGVGLRGGVGEGVQVGSIKIRGVGLGRMGVGGAEVGVDVGVGEAQLTRIIMKLNSQNLRWFMKCFPSGYGLRLHYFSIQPPRAI